MRWWHYLGMALLVTLIAVPAEAVPQVIQAEAVYIMGDNDSPKVARDAARSEAMRSATEQAGVYVESYTATHNLTLTADEVRIISGAVLKVIREEATPELSGGTWRYRVKLICEVDADSIDYKALLQNRKEIERLQRERDELKEQNAALLARYERATGQEKSVIGSKLEQSYSLASIFDRVVSMIQRGDNQRAIQEISLVIDDEDVEDNPLAYAYYLRGRAYYELRSDRFALADFDRAESITTASSSYPIWRTHQYRGLIYYDTGRYEAAADELGLAWDLSDKSDDELWLDLRRAERKAKQVAKAEEDQRIWGNIIGVIVGNGSKGRVYDFRR